MSYNIWEHTSCLIPASNDRKVYLKTMKTTSVTGGVLLVEEVQLVECCWLSAVLVVLSSIDGIESHVTQVDQTGYCLFGMEGSDLSKC